jgi:uncharacterized protein DUF4157
VRDVVRGAGTPLEPEVREEMSSTFGADLSSVRLHTDAAARGSAAALGALAYTAGEHIVAGSATLDRRTLAHELVHVVQQRRSPAVGGPGLRVSDPADRSERDAGTGAAQALDGGGAPLAVHGHAAEGGTGLLVQRQIDASAHPGAVLGPAADHEELRAYLGKVVNARHDRTFAEVVTDTIAAFPAESEEALLPRLWYWVEYVLDPGQPTDLDPRLIHAYLVALAEGVNAVHALMRDDALSRAPALRADALAVQKEVPLAAPSLNTKTQLLGAWLDHVDLNDITAPDLALFRRLIDETGSEVTAHHERGRLLETKTRLGFEIETGNHFTVAPEFVSLAERLINVTLASTSRVELLFDDIKHTKSGAIVQIEFRTTPFTQGELENTAKVRQQVNADIKNFPLTIFGKDVSKVAATLAKQGWSSTAVLERIAPGLTPDTKRFEAAKSQIQHVTHSIPLARFVRLAYVEKELLIPGSGGARTVEQLIRYLLVAKILSQSKQGTLIVTTEGRSSHTPNVKSALDTISGFLPPERFHALVSTEPFTRAPGRVRIVAPGEQDETGDIEPPALHEDIPPFPAFSVTEGRAYLAAEEKLKPILFDPRRKDIRVLVEHRSDALVAAVNKASGGNPGPLKEYLAVFRKLDDPKAAHLTDEQTFGRWFS